MPTLDDYDIYEIVNNTFKDMALKLGEIAQKYKVDEKHITAMANSMEDLYYKVIDRLETVCGNKVLFDTDECVRSLHPHPAIDSLLKAIGFMPLKKGSKDAKD